jgi:hypothetical protein
MPPHLKEKGTLNRTERHAKVKKMGLGTRH